MMFLQIRDVTKMARQVETNCEWEKTRVMPKQN